MSTVDPLTQTNSGTPQGAPSVQNQFNPGLANGTVSTQTGQGVYNPATITSAYESNPGSQFQSSTIVLGAELAGMLGLSASANKPIAISVVLEHFLALPSTQQIPIEHLLVDGHFYIDPTSGEPLSTPPPIGTNDPENVAALQHALLDTVNSTAAGNKSTLSSMIISGAQSGAAGQPLQPSPILGGGQTYQVELTSPQDLYDQLYTTFETNLGRAPTQKELNAFVNVFEGEQSKYQNSLNYQQEQMTHAKFSDQERQRNIELGYTQTPFVATGNLPSGQFHSAGAWANAFLSQVVGAPVTQSNVQLILQIINKNGGWAAAQKTNNPMGSAVVLPGGAQTVGPKGANPNAPATYANMADGMLATLEGLSRASYGQLLAVLQSGVPPSKDQLPLIQQELSQWSDGKIKTLPKADAATTALAHQVAASAAKANAAYNKKQQTPPAGRYNPAQGPPEAGFAGPGGKATSVSNSTGGTNPQTGAYPGNFTGGGPPPMGLADTIPNQSVPSGGRASAGASGGPQDTNSIQYRATHPPTGPGFSTAAIPPVGTAGAPTHTPPSQQTPEQRAATARLAKSMAAKAIQDAENKGAGKKPKSQPLPATPEKPWTPPPAQNAPYTGQTVSPLNLTQGQNQYSTGDIYQGASTLEAVQPPSATGAAFTQATTGENAVPYLGYQYLQAFGAIANMIASGRAA